jgi:hypothetical protein
VVGVPQAKRRRGCHPQQRQLLLGGHAGTEAGQGLLQNRQPRLISVSVGQRSTVHQEIGRPHSTGPRRSTGHAGDLLYIATRSGHPAREDGSGQSLQIGGTGLIHVDRFESLGSFEHQLRGVVAAVRDERELRADQVRPGALDLTQRLRLGHGQQVGRRVEATGLDLGLAAARARPARCAGSNVNVAARWRNAAAAARPPRA